MSEYTIKQIFIDNFKKTIDEMPDDEFIDMMFFLMSSGFEDDFDDEGFENPFSGEMVNFRCPDCKKISAYPIEIVNEIYEATNKEPQVDCYHCESHSASPIYYKAPNGEKFEN